MATYKVTKGMKNGVLNAIALLEDHITYLERKQAVANTQEEIDALSEEIKGFKLVLLISGDMKLVKD